MNEVTILTLIVAAVVISVILSVATTKIPPPAAWLTGWTAWLATVITIVVATRVFWIGSNYVASLF